MGAAAAPPAWVVDPRVRRASIAVLVAIGLSLVLTLLSGSGADTGAGRLGGDYPAFYAAGRTAVDEGLDSVNDLASLEAAQRDLYPSDERGDGYLSWAYPPHVALAYAPLSRLPYRTSYAVHTAAMAALFVATVLLARPLLPWLRRGALPAVALGLAYYPMFRGIGSGQNTVVTLFLLVAAWRASSRDNDAWAGVFLGLLLFKPQFAVLALLAWLAGGRWRALPGFALVAASTWALTAALAGLGWVGRYRTDLEAYRATEDVNAENHVSLSEAADGAFGHLWVGWVAAVAVLGFVLLQWWRHRRGPLDGPMALLAPTVLLCAAHAVFYDAGLVLLVAGVAVATRWVRWVGLLWLLGLVDPIKGALGWNPNALVLLAWLALAAVVARSGAPPARTEVA